LPWRGRGPQSAGSRDPHAQRRRSIDAALDGRLASAPEALYSRRRSGHLKTPHNTTEGGTREIGERIEKARAKVWTLPPVPTRFIPSGSQFLLSFRPGLNAAAILTWCQRLKDRHAFSHSRRNAVAPRWLAGHNDWQGDTVPEAIFLLRFYTIQSCFIAGKTIARLRQARSKDHRRDFLIC